MLCQCPKLSPLQARFLASVVALALLGLIYWSLSDAHFAYAAELDYDGSGVARARGGDDHNWHRIAEQLEVDGIDLEAGEVEIEVADGVLTARAPTTSTTAGNNAPNNNNIEPGVTQLWMFPKDQLEGDHTPAGPGLPPYQKDKTDMSARHVELRRRDVGEEDDVDNFEKRQDGNTGLIYISINTCLQPNFVGSGTQSAAPPQLTLYVSTDSSNTNAGPNGDSRSQREIVLDEGFARSSLRASGDWYMSVHAPSLPNNFNGVWNYELAVSIDGYYHAVETSTPNLFLVDTDSTAALLVTNNLTQANPNQTSYKEWMSLTAPYVVFATNANDTRILGLSNSFCGLNKNSQVTGQQSDPSGTTTNVQMEMITRGLGNKPKEQFYVHALNSSSRYFGTLALVGNSSASGAGVVGGGGKVWSQMSFTTKSDNNCALLYNLTFCDEVAYAVPSTPDFVSNYTNFQHFYDNYTRTYYHHFNYSLQQIPCTTSSDAQYSLAKNCADCARAYKEWLCAVSIPRCEDFSANASYLQTRNVGQPFFNGSTLPDTYLHTPYTPMLKAPTLEGTVAFSQTYLSSVATNSSRNRQIDAVIAPGPYKEVLPCEDLCYSLVQSCPAALGFGCPYPGRGLEAGYGTRHGNGNGTLTCSYLGAYVYTGAARRVFESVGSVVGVAVIAAVWLAL
jgi:calcium channel MID1